MIELTLNGIKKYFGATEVLDNITFEVQSGEKVGIVGRNGSGKSTILKIINGIENYDEGILAIRKGASMGYLAQIPNFPENFTVLNVLESAFEKLFETSHKMRVLEDKMSALNDDALNIAINEYGQLQHIFEVEGGYEIEEQMSKICAGLKIGDAYKLQPFSTLSGGEKTTVILGKILLQKSDIMLLDEPSNHLDMESIEWLEDYLKEYKGTALIVSHDRYFLDRVATKIVEIEDMEATTYIGNYSAYVETKEKNMLLQFEAFKEQQKKIQAMEKTIKDLRDWGLRADNSKFFKRAVSIEKKLEKMTRIERPVFEKENMKLNFSKTDRSGNDVIIIDSLTKGFNDKILLENAKLLVRYGEKTALIGKNGCGKSTLIKLILKEYEADNGSAELGASVKLGYLPQNINFENEECTVLEVFRDNIVILEGKAREYLAKFMFFGESVFKKAKSLSGGERSRLKLAMLMYEDINLLILDEPTNHLDIDSMETLEETLKSFEGTVFFISHDRYFINSLCGKIVEIRDKKLISYEGNYDYYRELRCKEKAKEPQEKIIKASKPQKTKLPEPIAKDITKDIKRLEINIEELEGQIQDIEKLMETYSHDHEKLNELFKKKGSLQLTLDTLMEEWIGMEITNL